MLDSKEFQKLRERFLPKVIGVNIEGYSELWELEKSIVGESKMYITYRLKKTDRYKVYE